MRFSTFYIFLSLLVVPDSLYAEVYKWVDKDGKVHFSDKPKSKDAKKFIYNPKTIDQETFKNNNKKKSTTNKSSHNELEIKRQQQFSTNKQPQTEKQKRYCNEAKKDLKITQTSQLLYNYDKNGKRYFLDEKQRKEVIEKKKSIVKKWCGK